MRSLEELLDLIPKYINDLLPQEETRDFETGLQVYPILKHETEEFRKLKKAFDFADRFDEGHIDHELLTKSILSAHLLSADENSRISAHTASCQRCRENEALIKLSYEAVKRHQSHPHATLLSVVREWLERFRDIANPVFRPAIGAVVIVLLAIPGVFVTRSLWEPKDGVVVHQMYRSGTRAGSEIGTVVIKGSDRLLKLEILAPVQDAGQYDFYLRSSSEELVYSVHGLPPEEPMIVEIPTVYLRTAEYIIVFEERRQGEEGKSVITKSLIRVIDSR